MALPQDLPGSCDATLGDAATVRFAPLGFSIADPDGSTNTALTYAIFSGNEGGYFSIDVTTGVISLERRLDRDLGTSSFFLVILISDGVFSATLNVTVLVEDVNDNVPEPTTPTFSGRVSEGLPRFTPILNVTFVDIDEGANGDILYSLEPSQSDFNIDPQTGSVTTNRVFDYEAGDRSFFFAVFAQDGGSPPGFGSANVSIIIVDQNDNRPSVNATLIPGAVYVEQEPPVLFASVIVSDADSDSFPLLFSLVRITNSQDEEEEVIIPSLPPDFKSVFVDSTLVVVGTATPDVTSSLLSNVTYSNLADEPGLPLLRIIEFGVCDQLADDSLLSLVTNITEAVLTEEDAVRLLQSCLTLVSSTVSLPLLETNDRPILLNVSVEFQPVPEDLPDDLNKGEFIQPVFSGAVQDSDRGGFIGIAVVGHGSPAEAFFGARADTDRCVMAYLELDDTCAALRDPNRCQCRQEGDSLSACGFAIDGSYTAFKCDHTMGQDFCRCDTPTTGRRKRQAEEGLLPPVADILRVVLDARVGSPIDITNAFINDASFSLDIVDEETLQQYINIACGNGSYIFTTISQGEIVIPIARVNITYEAFGNVSETSAVVLGPTSLIRFIPFPDETGIAEIIFKAWDGTNGLAIGSRGADTTVPTDTSFSLETGVATAEIVAVNDAPQIQLGGAGERDFMTEYVESGPSVFVASSNAVIVEPDNDLLLRNLRVNITKEDGSCDLPAVSNDLLQYMNETLFPVDSIDITTIGQACVSHSFNGQFSVNQWQSFLRMIRFAVADDEPSDHRRRLSFVISDAELDSDPSFTFIDVQLVSDNCPVIGINTTSPLIYIEHSGAISLDGGVTVIDIDRNAVIQSAEVTILETCSQCVLAVTSTLPGITQDFSNSTQTLRLTGPAAPADFQQVLRSVQFEDTGDEPSFSIARVRFTLIDPTETACPDAVGEISVVIEHINDNAPVLFLDYPISRNFSTQFTEGTTRVPLTGDVLILENDVQESTTYDIVVQITSGCVTSEDILEFMDPQPTTLVQSYTSADCSLTLRGSRSTFAGELPRIRYRNTNLNNPTPGERVITFTITDAPLPSTSSFVVLAVVAINDAPFVDLDISDPLSSDSMLEFVLGTGSILITGPNGGSITDPDDTTLEGMVAILQEIDSAGNVISPTSDQFFEELRTVIPAGLTSNYLASSGELRIVGAASIADYTAVLNQIAYVNSRIPPTENRREITVTVSDGELDSGAVVARIIFTGELNPPIVNLNGNLPGTSNEVEFLITQPPVAIFPDVSVSDPDRDNICEVNITLTGPRGTCDPGSISFDTAFGDIGVSTFDLGDGILYQITTEFLDCREAIVFQSVLSGVTFSASADTAVPTSCFLTVVAVDARRSISNAAVATVVVRQFNAPPFIDLDLGLSGRDYSVVYFQGGSIRRIVSILDEALVQNITTMTVVGEAAGGEAAIDDGTTAHGVVIEEQSNAGYVLMDVDSPELAYLQVEFVLSSTLQDDVIRYPCIPATPTGLDPRGCISNGETTTVSNLVCDNSLFEACSAPFDLCSDLTVTIFCPETGRKSYRFQYLANPSTERYEALLGYLGYQYLLTRGGSLNQIRILNVTAFDGESVNPTAITRIRIQNQDVLEFIIEPPPPDITFHVYEDERPNRPLVLYTVRVQRLDDTTPAPGEVEFSIVSGNIGNVWLINNLGEIFLIDDLDREVIPRYDLTISAHIIGADIDTTTTGLIIIGIIDVNDNHPLTAPSYTVNVTEGFSGTEVVRVIATDADEGSNAELNYLLLGIGVENFMIDSDGVVTTTMALDRTVEDFYFIVVIITDRGEIFLCGHTVININVVTPATPNLEIQPFDPIDVFEGTNINTMIGQIQAVEVGGFEGVSSEILYRIIGIAPVEPLFPFRINSQSGEIFVNAALDSERSTIYMIIVEAFSTRVLFTPNPTSASVTINILDVNEGIPMFSDAPYIRAVAENTPTGTTVLTLVAVDDDSMNQGLIYSLVSDPSGLPFSVLSNGDVIVSGTIDFETDRMFSFTVQVRDDPPHTMPSMSATAEVSFTILDRNDNPPVFIGVPYVAEVRETVSDGYEVLTFSTTDADSEVNRAVEYTVSNLAGTPFSLVGQVIQVSNSSLLTSLETAEVFVLEIVATNQGEDGTQLVSQETANISVILINEFPPVVQQETVNHPGYFEEHCGLGNGNSCDGIEVYDFGADTSDADGGTNGQPIFSLITSGVPFAVDSLTGILSITGRIDREVQTFYFLQISISDGPDVDGTTFNTTVFITIPIYDIDDNPPVFVPPFEFAVTEEMTLTTTPFGQVNISDPDINGTRSYFIVVFRDPPLQAGCIIDVPATDPEYLPIQIDFNTGELSFCVPVDFEADNILYQFTVRVVDIGDLDTVNGVTYREDQAYTVGVVDSNDHPPELGLAEYLFTHPENALENATVGEITATDQDAGTLNGLLRYSISFGGSSDCSVELPFQIDREDGVLRTCMSLDYELRQSYTFTVQVCDSAVVPMCDTAPVTVNVTDRNDNPPEFVPPAYTAEISETDSSLAMTFVVQLVVTDRDSAVNSEASFEIVTAGSPFALQNPTTSSVEVFVAQPALIDFETGPRLYVISVRATNLPDSPSDDTFTALANVTVTITDVNDNVPVILPPLAFEIRENEPEISVVGCINATDADEGENSELEYFLDDLLLFSSLCDSDLPFRINLTTGCISTCQSLDFEGRFSYSFSVTVCDRGEPVFCSNATITVSVTDLNDNSPVFDRDPYLVDVNENLPVGEGILFVSSTDADSLPNSLVFYNLVGAPSPFDIRSDNEVYYTGAEELDFEGPTRTYILTLRATNPPSDSGGVTNTAETTITISVVDRNDQPPVFDPEAATETIDEHSPIGTVVYALSTTDADTENNSAVEYIILQPIGLPFSILGNQVVVSDEESTDFDPPTSVQNYILTVQAINPPSAGDDEIQTSNFTLTVNLRDINDNAPECLGPVAIMLPEDAEVGVQFRRVLSDDIDSGLNGRDGLQFFVGDIMGSGSGAGDPLCSFEDPFRVDPDSGYLSICTAFDFERSNMYAINVTVCDSGSPPMCSVCPVAINIMDVNDNAPVILPPTEFTVEETVPLEFEIACINATDADTGQNAVLSYSIVEDSCTVSTPFQIVNRDEVGCIQVCRTLDFEQTTGYVFEVNVTDNGSPVLWNSTLVTITIINVNDHTPEITSPDTAEVTEEQADADVITVIASDADSPPFNAFTFSLLSDADGRFRINSTTGLVQTTAALDRESQPSYMVVIQVSDGSLSSTQNLTIFLIDINDNAPVYLGAANYSFFEEMLFEQVLVFSDPDVGNNSAFVYEVNDPRFTIDGLGVLRNVDPLDRDPATGGSPTITITVTVRDRGVPSQEAVVVIVIILIDRNDNLPIAQPPFQAEILDGARVGDMILDTEATDADEGDNARLVFKIGDGSTMFRINSTTGVIEVNEDIFLSGATVDTIMLQVNICDSGIPRNTISITYVFFVVSAVPLFPLDSYSFRIAENELAAEVGLLRAQDRDNNPFNDLYEYTILFVSPYDTGFSIRSFGENGTLFAPAEYFDFEDSIQFELTIGVGRMNMTGIIDDTAMVVVTLIDQNDNPPLLSPLNLTDIMLPESASNGYIVATAVAIDFDTGVTGQLTYNHSGDGAEIFEFDGDGNFRVANSDLLDFESNANFTFTYQACDGGTPQLCSETGFISITVINIDDLPPVFAPIVYTEAISEDFGPNRVILHVNFTDLDTPPEDVRLFLSPAQTQFQIIQISGALMSTDVPLDREVQGMHAFSVIANDTAGQTGMASVFIQLLDVNDVRPRVEPVQSTVTFLENDGRAFIADQLTIIDEDDISQYPLTTIAVSLHSSPSASEPYPLTGGICDHANYSILYDSNPYSLCGISDCDYLLSPEQITIQSPATLQDGILESPGSGFTRNSRIFLGTAFEEDFTMSIWMRLTSPTASGNIFEVTGGTALLGISVSSAGTLSVATSPALSNPITTVSLPTHDGEWHQVSLVRESNSLILYFDCNEVGRSENVDQLDTTSFFAGSFILGNRLSGFLSEMYFCLASTSRSDICCTINCGESFEISTPTSNVTTVVDQRTRRVEFEYTGNEPNDSLSALQEAIRTIIYVNRVEEPHPLDRGVLILVSDSISPSDEQGSVILSPILINDQRPILDLNGLATAGIDLETTFNERPPTQTDGTLTIGEDTILYDQDSGFFPINRIEINLLDPNPPNEFLFHTIIPPGFNIQVFDSGSRVLIQSSDPAEERFPDQFLDAVRLVMFRDVQEEPEEVVRRITFTVYDSGAQHINDPLAETRITLVQTNDQPVLDLDTTSASLDSSIVFEERDGRVKLLSGTTQSITDPDSTMAAEAVFTLTQRPGGEAETLEVDVGSLPSGVTVTQNFDTATGILTIGGRYSFSEWLEILRTVEYVNTERNPDELQTRMVAVQIQDADGSISEQAFVLITVQLFNNPPELFIGGPGVMNFVTTFVEDGPCVPVTSPDVEITDVDSSRGIRLIQIRLSPDNADDTTELLRIPDPQPLITVTTTDGSSITLSLADTTILNYQQQLARVEYCNTADEPLPLNRTITFVATDRGLQIASGATLAPATSVSATTTIQIVLVNDQPILDFEPVNNVSIRGEPTPIIDPTSIGLDDSDDDLFDRLLIFITNPQDGIENEIIEFARQLPEETFSIGPFSVAGTDEILYNVTFRGEGADRERVFETIAAIRYNNRAPNITVNPPRIICLQVSDFKIFSERVCADVEISPPNDGVPVFDEDTIFQTLEESNSLLVIGNLSASDADSGLAGEITFSILRVESTPIGEATVVTTSDGLFDIDAESGRLFAPDGLDADQYFTHTVSVTVSDSGNPVRSAIATVQVQLTDVNDLSPSFLREPYIAPEQAEGLAPQFVFQVEAVDNDATSPNNLIARYGLVNGGDQFVINGANGRISYVASLDAEVQIEYLLNVSAEDSGSPPQTSYTTVLFRLIDRNDNAAVVDQLATAIYVVEDEPRESSIGPAIRITDADIFSSAITGVTVTLTRNTNDQFRSYDRCLAECQDVRLSDAGLLSSAVDLLSLASFVTDSGSAGGYTETTIGDGDCPTIQLNRAANRDDDGYGRITRSLLPADFGSGDFSVSFVATLRNEGYILLVPDETNILLPPDSVEREFALWLRRRDIRFYYVYGPSRTRDVVVYTLTDTDPLVTAFYDNSVDPPELETRHFVLVVRSNPPEIDIYVNCTLLTRNGPIALDGPVLSPNPSIDVFIGQSRPHPVTSGRLGADLHGLYYHDTALSGSQILDFCSCGFEEIRLPDSLPSDTIPISQAPDTITVGNFISSNLIPLEDVVTILRGITYINTYRPPSFEPDRQLSFTLGEAGLANTMSTGFIRLTEQDDALPEIDLTGLTLTGIDFNTGFTEDAGPVPIVSSNVRIDRDVGGFVTPTFDRVVVELVNAVDNDETLAAENGTFILVAISPNGQRVDIVGPGIRGDFEPVLQTLTYNNNNNRPTTNFQRRISFTITDTEGRTNTPLAFTTIDLTSVNDAPEFSLSENFGDLMGSRLYREDSAVGTVLAPNAELRDIDGDTLAMATITLSSPNLPTDTLTFDSELSPNISGSYDRATGVLTLSGVALLDTYRSVLRNVSFESEDSPFNDGGPLSDTTRTVTIVVSDGDLSSRAAQVQIELEPVNNLPEIIIVSFQLVFEDGDQPLLIAPDAVIFDVDNLNLFSLTLSLSNDVDNDVLSNGVQTASVLIFGEDLLTNHIDILNSIVYINNATEPTLIDREVLIEVCDVDVSSCATATIAIEVRDRNDNSPMFGQATYNFSILENSPFDVTIGRLSVTDADTIMPGFTYTLSANQFLFGVEQVGSAQGLVGQSGFVADIEVFTTAILNFESVSMYTFEVEVNDGLNTGVTTVFVEVENANEAPSIVIIENVAVVGSLASETTLILGDFVIIDPDIDDSIVGAVLTVLSIPEGSDESLAFNPPIDGYLFEETPPDSSVYQLTINGSNVTVSDALRNIQYVAGNSIENPSELRFVNISVFDEGGLSSNDKQINVSLASVPQFEESPYNVSLSEGQLHQDFLRVSATVESGGSVTAYGIQSGVGVSVDTRTGFLSLVELLDRETEPVIQFQVFAVDSQPPARTGTTTVIINVLDENDVRPEIGGLSNITIRTAIPINPFPDITVTDPDISSDIELARITVIGDSPLIASPFTGRVCVDEHNIVTKMQQVCGLESFIDLLAGSVARADARLTEDEFGNRIFTSSSSQLGYSEVTANFSGFVGNISEFSLSFVVRVEGSGYIAYYGSPDATVRFISVFYDWSRNKLIVTLKRTGVDGLGGQIRVAFDLPVLINDNDYHFIVIEYAARDVVCVVDGLRVGSSAVVYKERPFIGEVFGKLLVNMQLAF